MADITFITPFFIVSDLHTSVSFYVDKLGFEIWHSEPPENPFWAMLGRDGVSVMLKAIAPDVSPIPNSTRHAWARWDAYINAPEPENLFAEFQGTRRQFPAPFATYRRRFIRI